VPVVLDARGKDVLNYIEKITEDTVTLRPRVAKMSYEIFVHADNLGLRISNKEGMKKTMRYGCRELIGHKVNPSSNQVI